MSFGKFLTNARVKADIDSINELGRISGVDPGYISRLERDLCNPPLPDVIAKLAAALKIPRNDLMHAAGYIDIPTDEKYKGLAHVCLTEEYINKGLTEEEIRKVLDGVVAYVKSKDLSNDVE